MPRSNVCHTELTPTRFWPQVPFLNDRLLTRLLFGDLIEEPCGTRELANHHGRATGASFRSYGPSYTGCLRLKLWVAGAETHSASVSPAMRAGC